MKIALKNVSKGWFSLAEKHGARLELKVNAVVVLDIDEADLNYYKQFIPLGIAIDILKDYVAEEVPVEFNTIEEVVDDINPIKPESEPLVPDDLAKLTKAQLKELCDSLEIKYPRGVLKAELVELLLNEYGDEQ